MEAIYQLRSNSGIAFSVLGRSPGVLRRYILERVALAIRKSIWRKFMTELFAGNVQVQYGQAYIELNGAFAARAMACAGHKHQ
jgi:hypothetical protein